MQQQINQSPKDTQILVAETVFKGVFNKRQLINHLSDNIAPKETARILNELIKDKLVRVGQVKEILEIDYKKLDKVKGIGLDKPIPKVKEIEERRETGGKNKYKSNIRKVGYCYRYTKNESISIIFRLSYSGALYSGTMFCEKELQNSELQEQLSAFIKAKYNRLESLEFNFIERQFN